MSAHTAHRRADGRAWILRVLREGKTGGTLDRGHQHPCVQMQLLLRGGGDGQRTSRLLL